VRGNLRLKGRKNKSLPLIRPLHSGIIYLRAGSRTASQPASKHPGNDKYLMTVILRNISARLNLFISPPAGTEASFSSSSLPFLLSSLCSAAAASTAALSKVSMELKGKACSALKRESERERRQGAQPFAVSS
jgi:hypothetical protein